MLEGRRSAEAAESRVLTKDRLLELGELRAGVETELLDQRLLGAVQGLERVGLTPAW